MLNSERGVVKPPNEGEFKSDRRANGYLPLAESASPIEPNERRGGDRRAGSYPLSGGGSPITEAQNRDWKVGTSSQPNLPSPIEPGKGAVPVNPFQGGMPGGRAMPIADEAKAPGGR